MRQLMMMDDQITIVSSQ